MEKRLAKIEREITKIKAQIQEFQVIRPGSLTQQYKNPKEQSGAFYQVSYTHQMKSKTQYIRAEFVKEIRQQISDYKKFRKLIEKWIELSIEYSQLAMKIEIQRQATAQKKLAAGLRRRNK